MIVTQQWRSSLFGYLDELLIKVCGEGLRGFTTSLTWFRENVFGFLRLGLAKLDPKTAEDLFTLCSHEYLGETSPQRGMAKQALVLLTDSTYSFHNPTPLTHRWLQNKLSCLASTSGQGIPQRISKQPLHLKYILKWSHFNSLLIKH